MAPHEDQDDHPDRAGALEHALRRRILELMSDGRKASPRQIAEELAEGLSNVSYHVGVLARAGALQPAGSKRVRGAKQQLYRSSLEPDRAPEMSEEPDDETPEKKRRKRNS